MHKQMTGWRRTLLQITNWPLLGEQQCETLSYLSYWGKPPRNKDINIASLRETLLLVTWKDTDLFWFSSGFHNSCQKHAWQSRHLQHISYFCSYSYSWDICLHWQLWKYDNIRYISLQNWLICVLFTRWNTMSINIKSNKVKKDYLVHTEMIKHTISAAIWARKFGTELDSERKIRKTILMNFQEYSKYMTEGVSKDYP